MTTVRTLWCSVVLGLILGCPAEKTELASPPPRPAPVKAPPPAPARPKRVLIPITTRPTIDPNKNHAAPDFVARGSGVFEDEGRRWFYAVGKSQGIENEMRAHLLADQSADDALLDLLRATNPKLVGDDPELIKKADEFAKKKAENSEIVDHWIDHDHNEWHSLHRLDVELYADALAAELGIQR